jgi:hypothetical protein
MSIGTTMPAAIAVDRADRNGWVGQILLPNPNCQRQIDAAVEMRKVTEKVFMTTPFRIRDGSA